LLAVAAGLTTAAYLHYFPAAVEQAARPGREPQPVLVATSLAADVPVYLEGLGTVRALNTVTVQPLVEGRLLSVDFKEGQDVKAGDLLARIDPTLYQATLDQAKAKQAQNEATLANARLDLDRKLRSKLASSQQQVDTAKALVAQLEALVKADKANVANATAQLGYTRIAAPIGGRTGIRMVDEGNVLRASAGSAIVTITQLQPISVLFNLPQQQLGRINAAMAEGNLKVDALAAEGGEVLDAGRLQVVDNQVDQTTGTVRLKAEFPNPSLKLWPGQFVNVRLLIDTLRQVVVVPTGAVQQGPDGSFVFVIADSGDRVRQRPIEVGQRDDRTTVVASGLGLGERVVISGFARLRDGSRVAVSDQPANASGGKAGPSGKKGRGKGRREKNGNGRGGEARVPANQGPTP
jgi:multidrug efflux system membrane fusion protein